jgi:DNA-nicking Smr family endonuclease
MASNEKPPHPSFSKLAAEDLELFRQAVKDVHRVHTDRLLLETPPPRAWPEQRTADEGRALVESISRSWSIDQKLESGAEPSFLQTGLTQQVLRDLRRGRWVSQGQIDLHGATRDAAHALVIDFIHNASRRGLRCVRVIHGKGLGSPGREPILKGLVLRWLMHRQEVLAYCQARPHEGGTGALIVLLKATNNR